VSAIPLVFEGVSRWFGDTVALADVDLALDGGVVGLLGHNGAGKSTALKLCAGFDSPSTGVVRVFGRDPRRDPSVYGRVGIVPDRDALWPFLGVRETVATLARLRGSADPDAAADAALGRVELQDAGARRVGELSHGMRQRVRIAAALAHDPALLLLDEPLEGLDPARRLDMVALIGRLGAEGRTVVVSSHVLHEVERMAEQVLVLVNGRLVAEGAPEAIRRLIDDVPRQVRIDAGPAAAALAGDLIQRGLVRTARLEDGDSEGRVLVETADVDSLARALPATARRHDATLRLIEPVGDDLESVYGYLHARARGARR
jgi:ABC-2 type transport system ATP-binding protein